jgi:hypothetical protein
MVEAPRGKIVFDSYHYCWLRKRVVGKHFVLVCKIAAAPVGSCPLIAIYLTDFMIYASESVCKFTDYEGVLISP